VRILVLHQHYWPEIAATAQLLTDLAEDLAEAGHDVHVVCGQPSYRPVPGLPPTLPPRDRHGRVSIQRLPTYRPRLRSPLRRVAHYASYFLSSLPHLLSLRADVVLVLSPPPLLLGLSGALFELLRGTPYVLVVEDLYPELALELGALREGRLYDALAAAAAQLHRRAAHVVAISDEMGERLVAGGVSRSRLSVIHNWADTREVVERSRDTALRRELGLGERFVALYAGNVSSTLGLGALAQAAELLRELPIELLVVGDGDARAPLEQEARRRGLVRLRFVGPRPRAELSGLLATGDVGLVTTRAGERGLRFPSKLFGVMAAARPVLAASDEGSELASLVRRAGCGTVVAPEDPASLADGLRRLFTMTPEERLAMGRRGRSVCERELSRDVATPRYRALLEEVAGLARASPPAFDPAGTGSAHARGS
jgi:colanic acid biosynthesis glycosyl transferase WcaI